MRKSNDSLSSGKWGDMKRRSAVLQILQIITLLAFCPLAIAVDTWSIDNVRSKGVLDEEDFKVIDDFIREAVSELVNSRDFTSIARIRAVIVSRKSKQAQYAEQYSKSCLAHIGAALEQSREIEPAEDGIKVRMNLLILIYSLGEPRLVDLAVGELKDESPVIRYWAVRAVTSSSEPTEQVIGLLKEAAVDASSEVMGLIADYAGSKNGPEADELLLSIADERIKSYAEWKVREHLSDIRILKALCAKVTGNSKQKGELGLRFAQLYSYAMQKYIKDINGGDFLNEKQKQELASVLVEVEDKCIGELTSFQQTVIKRAVEEGNASVLLAEHNRLLGEETKVGEIPGRIGFDYGVAEDGGRLTAPKTLPDVPSETATN
jgi:hypothetical protein